jgi:hypothetical protein
MTNEDEKLARAQAIIVALFLAAPERSGDEEAT